MQLKSFLNCKNRFTVKFYVAKMDCLLKIVAVFLFIVSSRCVDTTYNFSALDDCIKLQLGPNFINSVFKQQLPGDAVMYTILSENKSHVISENSTWCISRMPFWDFEALLYCAAEGGHTCTEEALFGARAPGILMEDLDMLYVNQQLLDNTNITDILLDFFCDSTCDELIIKANQQDYYFQNNLRRTKEMRPCNAFWLDFLFRYQIELPRYINKALIDHESVELEINLVKNNICSSYKTGMECWADAYIDYITNTIKCEAFYHHLTGARLASNMKHIIQHEYQGEAPFLPCIEDIAWITRYIDQILKHGHALDTSTWRMTRYGMSTSEYQYSTVSQSSILNVSKLGYTTHNDTRVTIAAILAVVGTLVVAAVVIVLQYKYNIIDKCVKCVRCDDQTVPHVPLQSNNVDDTAV